MCGTRGYRLEATRLHPDILLWDADILLWDETPTVGADRFGLRAFGQGFEAEAIIPKLLYIWSTGA